MNEKRRTNHKLTSGDNEKMDELQDDSVHLAVTSPPILTLLLLILFSLIVMAYIWIK